MQFRSKKNKKDKKQEKKDNKKVEAARKKELKAEKERKKHEKKEQAAALKQQKKDEKKKAKEMQKQEKQEKKRKGQQPSEHGEEEQPEAKQPSLSNTSGSQQEQGKMEPEVLEESGNPEADQGPCPMPDDACMNQEPFHKKHSKYQRLKKNNRAKRHGLFKNRKEKEAREKAKKELAKKSQTKKRDVKGKPKKSSRVPAAEPVPAYVDVVKQVLTECHKSNCTHPQWKAVEFDKQMFQFSVYWTRNAVGVKMAGKYIKTNKSKEKQSSKGNASSKARNKMSQVAYFACDTPCIYTNYAIAQKYVHSSVWPNLMCASSVFFWGMIWCAFFEVHIIENYSVQYKECTWS